MYRWPLGHETGCERCGGRGWTFEAAAESMYEDDCVEVYCSCDAGRVRKLVENGDVDWDDACAQVTGRKRGPKAATS